MTVASSHRTAARARAALAKALAGRRQEIERAVMTRTLALVPSSDFQDPEYVNGLREAVSTAVGFGLKTVESAPERPPSIPAVLLMQARLAARSGIGLDYVLRRYFAG